MNREQFINACKLSGYATMPIVKKYAETKEEFTDKDFQEVYELEQNKIDFNARFRTYQGVRTTKHLKRCTDV